VRTNVLFFLAVSERRVPEIRTLVQLKIYGLFCALEGETLATVTSFAHVRKYNTEIVVRFGHMFHILLLWL